MKTMSLPLIIGTVLFTAVCQAPAKATTYNYVGRPIHYKPRPRLIREPHVRFCHV